MDKDGKITAQGKTVPKVLVDGEEFFGDDPTLVTKNLRADMVDKVQLYEKSSDQATFTGVDDGNKTTTINIKLKEDKKSGYFGKVDAGIATDGFYQGQVMFNRFKAKQKFSVYGTSSNAGIVGLNWEDASKYSGGNNMEVFDGGFYFSGDDDELDEGGQYYGEGVPLAHNGGAHYDTKWNTDKETINTNYKIGSLRVKLNKNTINQNNLATSIINTISDEVGDKYNFRQKLDATYTLKLDSSSNIKLTVDGTSKTNNSETDYNSIGKRGDNTLLNISTRRNESNGEEQIFNISAFYNKKLKKLGRNYSFSISQKISERNSDGYLKSKNRYYDENEAPTGSETVDQYKINDNYIRTFASNLTYNEPLTKSLTLVVNYGFGINDSRLNRLSYNASAPGNYDLIDKEYSNDFTATQYNNQGGAVFSYNKPKSTFNFGTRINAVSFKQREALSNQRYNRSFMNWMPQVNYQYKFSSQRTLRFGYSGYTNQPTVDQLQPVKVNTDPLNIPLGNPNLKPAYSNNIHLNYNSYKILTNQNIYLNGSINFVNNQIINNTTTDEGGKSIRQAINLEGKLPVNYNLYSGLGRKIKALGMGLGLDISGGGSTSYNYINGVLNETNTIRFNPSLSVNKYNDKIEISVNLGPSYNSQVASVQKNISNKGWGTDGYGYLKIILPKKISIQTDANYTYTPKSASFDTSFEQIIINASIAKSFFKKEDLKLMLKGNDLLNQNSGFRRFANGNSITQTNYNNINRYFIFSLVWDFSKMGETVSK